jgi:ribonucleoside-diphosphate reductase alpha chain
MGHIRMMAAVQPFLSGAISKTVNMPTHATVEEIMQVYVDAWRLGLKAVAIYRDGSKRTQPLNLDRKKGAKAKREAEADARQADAISAEQLEAARRTPHRCRLPATRPSLTHKFDVAGHEGYINVGLYEDGRPGELFITMAKEGSTVGGMMDAFATAISLCLQYGVPLEALVKKFSHQRFEPSGMTSNRDIPFAKSIVDYLFRWLGMTFLEEFRKANELQRGRGSTPDKPAAPPAEGPSTPSSKTASEDVTEGFPSDPDGAEGISPTDGKRSTGALSGGLFAADEQAPVVRGSRQADPPQGAASRPKTASTAPGKATQRRDRFDQQFSHFQEDAPACDICGSITVRNGNCYKCFNCGSSLGCS